MLYRKCMKQKCALCGSNKESTWVPRRIFVYLSEQAPHLHDLGEPPAIVLLLNIIDFRQINIGLAAARSEKSARARRVRVSPFLDQSDKYLFSIVLNRSICDDNFAKVSNFRSFSFSKSVVGFKMGLEQS